VDKKNPYKVTENGGKVNLVVMNANEGLPAAFALMGTRAQRKVAIRLCGGCKGMDSMNKMNMLSFFKEAFTGFKGVAFSGATRQIDGNGLIDPMITDVPGVIAKDNNGCVALGTIPRTDMLSLQNDSRLVLDNWGTVPNPDMYGILIVQNGADGKLNWNGDLFQYFKLMENWKDFAGFSSIGVCSWNGGVVTKEEIMYSLQNGYPTILIKGSGRATDEVIKEYEEEDAKFMSILPEIHKIRIVDKSAPQNFRNVLIHDGFLEQ